MRALINLLDFNPYNDKNQWTPQTTDFQVLTYEDLLNFEEYAYHQKDIDELFKCYGSFKTPKEMSQN